MICPQCEREVRPVHFYRSGKSRCQNNRSWTLARRFELLGMIERGFDDEAIGAHFDCSADAVRLARKHHGMPSRTNATLNARKLSKMLGFGCGKKVVWLIEHGWLKGRRTQRRGGNRQWLIKHDALMQFLAQERYWHLWDPEAITDTGLKAWALRERGDVYFLTLSEASARLFVETRTLHQWIRKGWIAAVRSGVTTGNHLIRADVVTACARRPWGVAAP